MTQKTGALIFDETADRYDIRFDLNDYYGGCSYIYIQERHTLNSPILF